ncbi:hypothetical protein F5879DRAFT_997493 [Lentinula edodes]|nr:hypothetical protein F5879DRAFT_997493 [Lentinula edodes]
MAHSTPGTPTITSKVVRGFRGSLQRSTTKLLSLSSSKDKLGSAAGTANPLSSVVEDGWTDSDYCHISTQDLPIPLDDPVTARSSSLTLAVRTPVPETSSRFSFTRLKNLSRISVSLRRPKSIQHKERVHLPFFNKSETSSILDEFPQPPSHIPVTPMTPAGYTWPLLPRPLIEEEHLSKSLPVTEIPRERSSSRESNGPFKSLTRALTRLGRHTSTKAGPTVVAESTTIIVRPPRPTRTPPDPPVEEQKTYQVVDPLQLTASPSSLLSAELSMSNRNSFIPPSPSWLSRNVQPEPRPEPPTVTLASSEDIATPSSPSPLPIPPRILVSSCSDSPLLSPLEAVDWLEYPEVADIRQSFVSIINARREERNDPVYKPEALLLKPSTPFLSVSTPTAGIPSPLAIPRSPTPSYIQFASRASFAQLESFESDTDSFDSPDSKPTLVSDSPPPTRDIFVPTLGPTEPDLPRGFSNFLSTLFIEAGLSIANHNKMDYAGKRNDVVDFGGETDYENMEWFKEAPPEHLRPHHQPAEPIGTPYVPDSAVIDQNEAFEFALSAAPNVLYARYKQYGQLGVLAWCAEFGELIDNLKELGFAGNMFVSTRTQALKTCEEILKLHLNIEMQIIMLYLSSQVSRLRRFLDGDRVWDDYPVPSFPLDPSSSTYK